VEVWTSTLGSTQDDDEKNKCSVFGSEAMTKYLYEKYKYSVSGSATFTWNATKMIKLSKKKYQTVQSGSICNNIGKFMQ
jgi:hypothetical protein